MEKKPKYAAGDTVELHGRFGVVQDVHEENYIWGGGDIYYEYTIRFDNGDIHRVAEGPLDKARHKSILCECGAWSVHWASNQHSRWCPAHKTFERGDS